MLLFIDQQEDLHADWIEAECDRRNVAYVRFCTETFPQETRLAIQIEDGEVSGAIHSPGREVSVGEITGVWYRRPGEMTFHPDFDEAYRQFARNESHETLYGLYRALWDRRWVSPPHHILAANHKIHQLRLARKLGFQTAPTLVTNDPDQAMDFFVHRCDRHMVYKALRVGMIVHPSGDIDRIYTALVTQQNLEQHLDSIRLIPCLFQKLIPKRYELRINIIGDRIWAAAIYSQDDEHAKLDYRPYTETCRHAPVLLPPTLEVQCLELNRHLGLRMSNVDMIVTPEGEYVFLEINPNGQWAWVEDLVGFPLAAALVDELLGVDTLAHHPYIRRRSLRFEPNTAIKARQPAHPEAI